MFLFFFFASFGALYKRKCLSAISRKIAEKVLVENRRRFVTTFRFSRGYVCSCILQRILYILLYFFCVRVKWVFILIYRALYQLKRNEIPMVCSVPIFRISFSSNDLYFVGMVGSKMENRTKFPNSFRMIAFALGARNFKQYCWRRYGARNS